MVSLQQMFNPAVEDYETLKGMMVGREEELQSVLERLKTTPVDGTSRSFVVIGPRGMGKSHLLLLIYHELKQQSELRKKYISLKFSEEEYSIDSLAYFYFRILEELTKECKSKDEKNRIEDFLNKSKEVSNKELVTNADTFLNDLFKKYKLKIVLCADNLDEIFNNVSNGGTGLKQLRSILQSKDYLIMIGSSTTHFKQIKNYGQPFYSFFELIRLDQLSGDEIEQLILRLAQIDGENDLFKDFDSFRPRVKTIVHFTGGSPRLVRMLYYVIVNSEILNVADYLKKLLDELTPYYQGRMAGLSRQQRKIVDTIALMDGPSTPTEIAKAGRMERATVTAQIKKLTDSGFIQLVQQKKRKWRRYDITERMFRIWREMRQPKAELRVTYLIKFLKAFYTPAKIQRHVERIDNKSSFSLKDIDQILYYSLDDFKNTNYGTVKTDLSLIIKNKNLLEEQDLNTLFLDFFIKILKVNLIQGEDIFEFLKENLSDDFVNTFKPIEKTIGFLKTKDEELLEKLFPEEREIVEELVRIIQEEQTD